MIKTTKDLKEAFSKTTFAEGQVKWDDLKVKEDYIHVPQGSYLGETLICLGDDYEESGEDCFFIQELLRLAKEGKLKVS